MKMAIVLLLAMLLAQIGACAGPRKSRSINANDSFRMQLERIRAKYELPALAAIIVTNKAVIHVGATGRRAIEASEEVSISDKFHFGSNTKSMTATLLAKMIEDGNGNFNWDDTIELVFPHIKIHEDYKNVTLEQLLRHQGGTTNSLIKSYPKMWNTFWKMQQMASPSSKEQRALLATTVLSDRPTFQPGSQSNYSNTGISLVGHAIENKLGRKYEEIIKESLFSSLKMKSCAFGSPGSPNHYDQPRGHTIRNGKITSVKPGPLADNPDAIAPAGKVYCSIVDWGKYIQEHLKGAQSISHFLKNSSFQKLHSPLQNQIFGLGWLNLKPSWAKDDHHLFHNGSNSMNYAEMWISPKQNYAIAVVTNIANQKAMQAVRKSVEMIAVDFLKK